MSTPINALKRDLRRQIKTVLSEVPEAVATAQTANAVRTLLSTPEYKAAEKISVYLSMPSGEISTTGIVHDALKQGKQVFIPYTYNLSTPREGEPKSIMDMLELKSIDDFESLVPDKWGIPTPSQASVASRANSFGGIGTSEGGSRSENALDMIVMPGMAFDTNFGRLGHGKGFYDHFLHRCQRSSRMPFRIGLSLTQQFLPPNQTVPMTSTDFRLDALILGDGGIRRA